MLLRAFTVLSFASLLPSFANSESLKRNLWEDFQQIHQRIILLRNANKNQIYSSLRETLSEAEQINILSYPPMQVVQVGANVILSSFELRLELHDMFKH